MRTQPVLAWSGVTTAVAVVLAVATGLVFGFGSPEFLTAVSGLGISGPLVAGAVARTKVTPLADPRGNDGVKLVRWDPRTHA